MGKTFKFILFLFFDDIRMLKSFPIKLMNRYEARNSVLQDENNLSNRLTSLYNITILAFSWIIISLILWGLYFASNKKSSVIQRKDLYQNLDPNSGRQEYTIPPGRKDLIFFQPREETKQIEPAQPLIGKEVYGPAQIVKSDIKYPIVTEEAPLFKAAVKPNNLHPLQNQQESQSEAPSTTPGLNPPMKRDTYSRKNVQSCLCFKNLYKRTMGINSVNNFQNPKQPITNKDLLESPKPSKSKESKETIQITEEVPQSKNDMNYPIVTEDIPLLKSVFKPLNQDRMILHGYSSKPTVSYLSSSSDDKITKKDKKNQDSQKINHDNTILLKGAAQMVPFNPDKIKDLRVLSSTEYKPPVQVVQPQDFDLNIILRPVSAFTTENMKNPSTSQRSPFSTTTYPLQPSHSNLNSSSYQIAPENSYILTSKNKNFKKTYSKTENQNIVPSKLKRRSADIHPIIKGYKVDGHVRVKGKKNTDTISIMEDEYDVLT